MSVTEKTRSKVALVTGASRGLGLQFRNILLQLGYAVHGCSRSDSPDVPDGYTHHLVDVGESDSVKALFREIKTASGGLDVLVNNVGLADRNLLKFVNLNTAEDVFRINVLSNLLCCQEALRLLRKSEAPRIVNISSIHVPLNTVGSSVYSASKAAVEQLTRSFAKELSSTKITVNCLGLSYVEGTGMNEATDAGTRDKVLAETFYPYPLQEEQLRHALSFLISEHAAPLSGQIMYLGGVTQ